MNSLDKLKKWLKIKDGLKLFNRNQRGVYTTENIEKNKIIIKIKSKYLIEYQDIYSRYPIDNIAEANSLVAFYLTKLHYEQDNFWKNYLDTMPTDLSEFPYFWPRAKLNHLKQTSFYSNEEINYQTHLDAINQDFEIIEQFNQDNDIISNISYDELYDTYLRFRILVGSRIFGYLKKGNETSGMVPYIDLLNHSEIPNTLWYFDDDLDSFVLISTRNINKGEELTDNYGNKNNIELLLYYGFTLDSNPLSILSTQIDNIHYSFTNDFNVIEISNYDVKIKKKLKDKLEKIHINHKKKIQLCIDTDITNILSGEIKIIKLLLDNL
jgi:hypothetical protein